MWSGHLNFSNTSYYLIVIFIAAIADTNIFRSLSDNFLDPFKGSRSRNKTMQVNKPVYKLSYNKHQHKNNGIQVNKNTTTTNITKYTNTNKECKQRCLHL